MYSKIESVVLRNLLHSNRKIVNSILDTQAILDDIIKSDTKSNADYTLIDQLTAQLIQLKSKLYQSCQTNMECHIPPLRLFPNNKDIYKVHSRSVNQSIILEESRSFQSIQNAQSTERQPMSLRPTCSSSSKPEFEDIKNQLSLLRKSFSV